MKLICHIGTPQTDAPLIQASMAKNARWLAKRGIVYADLQKDSVEHTALVYANANQPDDGARALGLQTPQDLRQLRERLSQHLQQHCAAARQAGQHTMIMSSQLLSAALSDPDEITRLKEFLQPHFSDIKILMYLRRQDDVVLAAYDDHIRRGLSARTLEQFVDDCLGPKDLTPYIFYRREISRWQAVWGKPNLILRRYSKGDFIQGTLLADMLGVVLGSWTPDLTGFCPARLDNAPLSAPALEFLRQIQPQLPARLRGQPNPLRAQLMPQINALPADPRPIMPAALAHQIMQHFVPANTWLKEQFAPQLEGDFFPDRPDHPAYGNVGQISAEAWTQFADLLESADVPDPDGPDAD